MAGYHEVKQGEHLARLAHEYGFADHRTIWDHPNNSEIKAKRDNVNVLYPGDLVYVPDRNPREETCGTDNKHKFQVKKPSLNLRLTLEALYDHPLADSACDLSIENDLRNVTTDGEGQLDEPIPPQTERVTLIVRDPDTPIANDVILILVGSLDPVEKVTGQQARLNNLGYYAGEVGSYDAEALRSAVEEFQCEHNLTLDGICGPKTQARLREVHGS